MFLQQADLVKVFVPTALAFIFGICITPILTHYLYKHRAWKKITGKIALDGNEAVEFNKLHQQREGETPRMGGLLIWGSLMLTILSLYLLDIFFRTHSLFSSINFLSRSQTFIPVATYIVGAVVGLLNDFYDVSHRGGGIRLRVRLGIITVMSTLIGYWFYAKLGVDSIGIPYFGALVIGALVIPFFVFFSITIYASGIIDGIDGLSGGVFGTIYGAYAILAFYQGQLDIAALSGAISGATLAFLWFNIPPARFWMTEVGTMPLTLTLAVIALMTDTLGGGYGILVFPVIGIVLVVTVLSSAVQIFSKRFRNKKIFRVAPFHHHLEAIGWPSYKVTMRYWVIGIIAAVIGLIIGVTG